MTTILVIDDEPSLRLLTRVMLTRLNYEVLEAVNGIQGEVIALEAKPDVIMLDLMMPQQDGFITCKNLRKQGYTGKIVFVSALTDYEGNGKASSHGANGYIEKPLTVSLLKDYLDKILVQQVA